MQTQLAMLNETFSAILKHRAYQMNKEMNDSNVLTTMAQQV